MSKVLLATVATLLFTAPALADDTDPDKREDIKWIKRWAPERNMVELGVFGGVAIPHPQLELFEPDLTLPDQGFKRFKTVAPDVGGRAGFYPSRFLGLELEGAVIPTATRDDEQAILWALRGHLVAQVGLWSVTPFALAGVSALGVVSERQAVGNDLDAGFHFGGGVKIFVNRYIALRLDVRDTLTAKQGIADGVGHTVEILGGFTITLNRKRSEKRPEPQPEPPAEPIDTDGDGIFDPDDACPEQPGVPEYDGCPVPDTDSDGILDPDDKCVEEPETKNEFEDADGCPDEIPEEVKKFTGVIEGIFFDTNKATIKPKSRTKLNNAAKVLKQFPTVKLEISGHTDSRGGDEYNMDLSGMRAEAVRRYLVDRGVDGDQLETRGAGEEEPRDSNDTKSGRAKNRRIEFRLLSD